jgi:SAM-dependent methyltransferase
MSAEEVYAAMRSSAMRNWVGPGDPEAVGRANFTAIIENISIRRDVTVLDFGCGIGRTSAALAEFLKEGGQLVGTDIVPGQIQFCREQIGQVFPNTTFHCVKANNPHYNHLVSVTETEIAAIDESAFFSTNFNRFDLTVAFSVFTHFDPTMAAYYLRALNSVMKPTAHLLLTWFLDHPDNPSQLLGMPVRLKSGESFADPGGDLGLALFSPTAVAQLASNAGLLIERISFGFWRGTEWSAAVLKGQHYQDIVILRRALPNELNSESAASYTTPC